MPLGWRNAIGYNSNSITYAYNFSHEIGMRSTRNNNLIFPCILGDFTIGLWGHLGATMGNVYRSLNTGLSFEMGFYKYPNNRLNGNRAVRNSAILERDILGNKIDVSFITNYNYSYFMHNSYLQGNNLTKSNFTLRKDQIINNVHHYEIGFKLRFVKLSGGFLWSYRSPVHELNDNRQAWGRVFITYHLCS